MRVRAGLTRRLYPKTRLVAFRTRGNADPPEPPWQPVASRGFTCRLLCQIRPVVQLPPHRNIPTRQTSALPNRPVLGSRQGRLLHPQLHFEAGNRWPLAGSDRDDGRFGPLNTANFIPPQPAGSEDRLTLRKAIEEYIGRG